MSDSSPAGAAEAVAETTVNAEAGTATQVSDAQGSASSTEQKAGSMLETVKAALEHKEASPASQEPGSKAEAETPDSKAEEPPPEDDKLSEEELKALSQKTQRRFQGLTSKIKAKDQEIEGLRPKAEEFDKIDQFVKQSGMSHEQVGFHLTVGALIASGRPDEALKQLLPVVQQLQSAVGDVLPADLQEKVRLGYISEADARDLSRARAGQSLATQRAEQSEAQRRQEAEQRQTADLINKSTAAAEKWESSQASKDPDWHLKRTEVAEKVKLAILERTQREGKPWFPNATEIVELSDTALKAINKFFKLRNPPAGEVRPLTAGGAAPRQTPKPTSMFDVVRNAVSA